MQTCKIPWTVVFVVGCALLYLIARQCEYRGSCNCQAQTFLDRPSVDSTTKLVTELPSMDLSTVVPSRHVAPIDTVSTQVPQEPSAPTDRATSDILREPAQTSCTGKELSLMESLTFIEEPKDQWRLRRRNYATMMKLERQNSEWCERPCVGKKWFAFHYEESFNCPYAQRIGKWGDGGKWVCDPHRLADAVAKTGKGCLVYSVGSQGEFDFEEAVLKDISPNCEIHTFDPGNYHAPKGSSIRYHAWAIGGKPPQKTMSAILDALGHRGRVIDILKVDCEGCEWEFFKGMFDGGVEIRQLLFELHWGSSFPKNGNQQYPAKRETVEQFFKVLTDHGYAVFKKQPNTHACGGDCIEISFLKLSKSFSRRAEPAWCGA